MKILYFCNVNHESKAAVGVFKKIVSQIEIMRGAGHEVHLAFYETDNIYAVINESSEKLLEINMHGIKGNDRTNIIIREVTEFILQKEYRCVYSRYETYSLTLARFYKNLHKNNCFVLLEIPTYPITQRWTTIKTSFEQRKLKTALHQFYNATFNSLGIFRFKEGIDRIVNNNGFSRIWGVETLAIHNAADVKTLRKHTARTSDDNDIHLIGVANIAKWHGFDRVIQGIKEYKQKGGNRNVFFHVVGGGLELENLKEMSKDEMINKYILFHGTVVGDELDMLFDNADIGVSVLATYRSKMKKECDSLKSKEYCARGIPFITGELEHFYDGEDFVLTVADNGTPLDIDAVCNFFDRISGDSDMVDKIRLYAQKYCGWDYVFKSVIDYLKENDDE